MADTTCPQCGRSEYLRSCYGGERGEAGPFLSCDQCGYDQEDEYRSDKAAPRPQRSINDLLAMLRSVMEAIEEHEAYRDDVSMERLAKQVPWIREVLKEHT